jgi:putative cardiolipin synthase
MRRVPLGIVGCGLLLVAGCATLPPGSGQPKAASHALEPSTDDPLGRTFLPLTKQHGSDSGFRMVSEGVDGLTARVELIDAAQRSLDLQTYIFHADESGNLIARALLRAADRGVRIRILTDDGETVAGDERILSLAARSGIEIRIFNPLRYRGHNRVLRAVEFLLDEGRLDYRMHDKLMVADGVVAIIGGRNIGDQYFQIDPASQFGDDDVVVAGPTVGRLEGVFDQFWNSDLAVPAPLVAKTQTSAQALSRYVAQLSADPGEGGGGAKALAGAPAGTPGASAAPAAADVSGATRAARQPLSDIIAGRTPLVWAQAKLVYDSPDKKDVDNGDAPGRLIYRAVAEQADAVATELLMITPYFVPSPDELRVLKQARERKAAVRILTNSLPAAPNLAAQSGYMHYRVQLLQEGVELYEIRALLGSGRGSGQTRWISRHGNYALHAKEYIFDRKTLFVGSMNFDQRSKHLNTEIGLLIASPELSRDAARRFDSLTRPDNAYALSLEDATAAKPQLIWKTQEEGKMIEYRKEPARSAWQRLKVKLLSFFPLDKEL